LGESPPGKITKSVKEKFQDWLSATRPKESKRRHSASERKGRLGKGTRRQKATTENGGRQISEGGIRDSSIKKQKTPPEGTEVRGEKVTRGLRESSSQDSGKKKNDALKI